MPKRLQRKRTKGFKLPAGAICVTRPGPFGNPYATAEAFAADLSMIQQELEAEPHKYYFSDRRRRFAEIVRRLPELRGHNLACYCKLCPKHANGLPLGETCPNCAPCHADVLLELANK